MQFRDLSIGTQFDFIDDENRMLNSFYDRCVKITPRKYRSMTANVVHTIGTIDAKVFHVDDRADVLADYREECKADADRTGRRAW